LPSIRHRRPARHQAADNPTLRDIGGRTRPTSSSLPTVRARRLASAPTPNVEMVQATATALVQALFVASAMESTGLASAASQSPFPSFRRKRSLRRGAAQQISGVCMISVIVDARGYPQNPRVIRSLGMGLDERRSKPCTVSLQAGHERRQARPRDDDGPGELPPVLIREFLKSQKIVALASKPAVRWASRATQLGSKHQTKSRETTPC